jgi:hypothetical protein
MRKRPFASFLPGIAGEQGIPLWVFTVNRGQAIAGFGIEDKDNPIMEFLPANKAYQQTPTVGFRTFLNLSRNNKTTFYEPFAATDSAETMMQIGINDLEISVEHAEHGVAVNVCYFTLTDQPFAGLVRTVTVTNSAENPLSLELLDGLACVQPYGVDDDGLKNMGRTLQAWMAVFNLENGVPFYKLQASADDSAEVSAIDAGHFFLSFDDSGLLPVIVDPDIIFDYDISLTRPVGFEGATSADLLAQTQITTGKTPCGFSAATATLDSGASMTFHTIVGHTGSLANLQAEQAQMATPSYVCQQHTAARQLAQSLTDKIATKTSNPLFDAYCRQTFLDNVLRGGWPILLDKHVYYIYSRKHGDIERDYNAFFLAAEPYSQGNANFRDVNQNRRNDVWFNPAVGDFNVRLFLSLIQLDGYNPLVVKGTTFTISAENRTDLRQFTDQADLLASVLQQPFTPGSLLRHIADHNIELSVDTDTFLAVVLRDAEQQIVADFGEGFWIDHWTYTLDLIDSFLAIYPEQQDALLFNNNALPFAAISASVRPRSEKYVLTERGVRQYDAVREHEHGAVSPWVMTQQREIYRTTAFVKLLCLALNKFATLDAAGMGVEMEAGKPGWYDALNGLPGLLGSSLPETYELLRLLRFLEASIAVKGRFTMRIPMELYTFLYAVAAHLNNYRVSTHPKRDYYYWDAVAHAREAYRNSIKDGLTGREERLRLEDLTPMVTLFREQVEVALQRATEYAEVGVPITYLRHEATQYEPIPGAVDGQGRPLVTVREFRPKPLPLFLEGPVHALKLADHEQAKAIHTAVLQSDLYDSKLAMFKVNASLTGESQEIGRARAFTPGWLENESIWLHMAYKYLLELLGAGLYDEFFAAFKTGLIPFQDPARYGRSPLENSSFLVSSVHPDESLHGNGFVARLSGATAEFLSLYNMMMVGESPFQLVDGELVLGFRPILPAWLFSDAGQIQFTFLGHCAVTYNNPQGRDTYGADAVQPESITLYLDDGNKIALSSATIPAPYAGQVRAGSINRFEIQLG